MKNRLTRLTIHFFVLFAAFGISLATASEAPLPGVGVHIWPIDVDPDVERTLQETVSSRGFVSCETVATNAAEVAENFARIVSDRTLLRQAPVRLWLHNRSPITFFGLRGGTSESEGKRIVHYTGRSQTTPVSTLAIELESGGRVRGTLNSGREALELIPSNKLPTHFLCRKSRPSANQNNQ